MPLEDPLVTEVVGIPTRGMERWLAQQLALRLGTRPGGADGVCANVDFRFLGSLIGRAAAPPGVDFDRDPWRPERAVWALISVVDVLAGVPWLAALAGHLAEDGSSDPDGVRRGRRFGVLRRVVDLFDRYGMHRPEMIVAWASGEDTDGQGGALAPELIWQAMLWRALREEIGWPSPAERLEADCARICADPGSIDLPARVAVLGVTRIPATYLRVVRAVATAREVHLFVLHPSPVLWSEVEAAVGVTAGVLLRRDDPTAGFVRHPLLASWGRDACEMQLVLGAGRQVDGDAATVPGSPSDLLSRLQADIRANRAPAGAPIGAASDQRAVLEPEDRSLQIHSCHGRVRQVEVLRDAVLHLLSADPTLEPRDVIVMCPDIEAFAPLIEATFGAAERAGDGKFDPGVVATSATSLRVRIADRSLRDTNPLLGVIARVLALTDERGTATQVLELAALGPVRARFGFTDEDVDQIEEWVRAAGIRWGLDATSRAAFALEGIVANTWAAGIDRLLVGVAMSGEGDRLVGGVLPLDAADAAAIDLVGRLAEFVRRLREVVESLQTPQPMSAWVDAITASADLLTASGPEDAWQRAQLTQMLTDVAEQAKASKVRLALKEIRSVFGAGLRGRAGRANFRTGHMTVSSLVPMRGVPYRVVCLLGLDDGVFPGKSGRDGDDIAVRDPRIGDRDARSDDLQQLLDAVMAAQQHLIITYAGRNERTNLEQPPAVPVGELLDVLGRMTPTALEKRVLITHPLQPFDPRNFRRGALAADVVWSFDATALQGARALVAGSASAPVFLTGQLPLPETATIELGSLVRFVEHPVREFLAARLGVRLRPLSEELAEGLPVGLQGLEKWGVGDRMLAAALAGTTAQAWAAAERARGTLPPGGLGDQLLEEIRPAVDELAASYEACAAQAWPESVYVDVKLRDGRRLVGLVPELHERQILSVGYSRLAPKARLRAWVYLLAVLAHRPSEAFWAVTIGRNTSAKRTVPSVAWITGLDGETARECLERLVGLYDQAMCTPPMIFTRTSAAYAAASVDHKNPDSAMKSAWERQFGTQAPGENEDPAHRLVLGGQLPFADFWKAHGDVVGGLAVRLWGDLLAHEQITST